MRDPVHDGARAAAARLAPRHGEQLPRDVEAALHSRDPQSRPEQYFDPISLGGLIVSIATLAWTIYKDHKKQDASPQSQVIVRMIRLELAASGHLGQLDPAQRDQLIETTVEETIQAADHSDENLR